MAAILFLQRPRRVFLLSGRSRSSGRRYNHGFYGHLFALLNSEKPVPTYFFTYNSRNQLIFNRKEKSLWLNFFDLVGNFHIDWKESEWILKDAVKIKDKTFKTYRAQLVFMRSLSRTISISP